MPSLLATSGRLDPVLERSEHPIFPCPHCGRCFNCIDIASGILSGRYRLAPDEAHRTLLHAANRVGSTAHALAENVIDAAAAGRPVPLP